MVTSKKFRVESYTDPNRGDLFNISHRVLNDENIYTLLVGENGCGKTHVLQKLIEELSVGELNDEEKKFHIIGKPSSVIALSTAKYDKFPKAKKDNYRYMRFERPLEEILGRGLVTLISSQNEHDFARNEALKSFFKYLEFDSSFKLQVEVNLEKAILFFKSDYKNTYIYDVLWNTKLKKFFTSEIRRKKDCINKIISELRIYDFTKHEWNEGRAGVYEWDESGVELKDVVLQYLEKVKEKIPLKTAAARKLFFDNANADDVSSLVSYINEIADEFIATFENYQDISYIFTKKWKIISDNKIRDMRGIFEKDIQNKINELYGKYYLDDPRNLDLFLHMVSNNFTLEYKIAAKGIPKIEIINNYNFKENNEQVQNSFFENMAFLFDSEVIKVNKILLTPIKSNFNYRPVDLQKLSSGQLCIITIMLALIGTVKDNALICIDEPEISLHPKWQEDFIENIQDMFSSYRNCHFIIATHSPQIVSGLKGSNGFVLDMESNKLHKAEEYSKKSVDYQLAQVFGAPGNSNEYLIRITLILLTKVVKNHELSSDDLAHIEFLNDVSVKLSEDDPVFILIKQLLAMREME